MAAAASLMILVEVTKRYESPDKAPALEVLRGITCEVLSGETVAIVGPSGSGKSTLLNIIGTLDRPTSGQVKLQGVDLGRMTEVQLAAVRNRQVGFVFQSHYLLPQCSVLENVLVPTLAGSDRTLRDGAEERAQQLLQRVGLGARLGHRPGQLSGGERQRVAVVRALINRPKLLLADEPTGSLDHAAAKEMGQLLIDLNREQNVTLIVVTHAADLAKRMARVLELRDGKLLQP